MNHNNLKKRQNCTAIQEVGTNMEQSSDNTADLIENYKYGYDHVNNWIGNADNKVSVSCALFTGVFGVVNFLSDRIIGDEQPNEFFRTVYHISVVAGLLFMAISILFYVLAINPNLGSSGNKSKTNKKNKNDKQHNTIKNYPIFYGDIKGMELDEYKEKMRKATSKDLMDELLTETHYNSGICMKKMKNYQNGLWLSFFAVGLALVGWASRFLMYQL